MKNDYLSYQAEELAQEADFIRWVRGDAPALAKLWQEWLAIHPEEASKIATAKALVLAVQWEVPDLNKNRKQAIWEAIDEATSKETKAITLPRSSWRLWAAAASVLLLLGAGWWLMSTNTKTPVLVQTDRSEIIKHDLPDGSEVSINAASNITYTSQEWQNKRTVLLEGEAFFSVEKGQPFIVKTELGEVKVLGTSFNVEVRNDIFRVNCYTGSVQVSTLNGDTIILKPQEGTQLVNNQLVPKAIRNQNDIAWQQQIHHFIETPLAEVFSELERQYPVTINYPPALEERLYTGFFKNDNLEQALQSICWPMKLTFSINQQQVTINTQ